MIMCCIVSSIVVVHRYPARAQTDSTRIHIEVGFPDGEQQEGFYEGGILFSLGCYQKPTDANSDEFKNTAWTVVAKSDQAIGIRRFGYYDFWAWAMPSATAKNKISLCTKDNSFLTILASPKNGVSFFPASTQVNWNDPTAKDVFITVRHPIIILMGYANGHRKGGSGLVQLYHLDGQGVGLSLMNYSRYNSNVAMNASDGIHTLEMYMNGYKPLTYRVNVNAALGPTILRLGVKGSGSPSTIIPAGTTTEVKGFEEINTSNYKLSEHKPPKDTISVTVGKKGEPDQYSGCAYRYPFFSASRSAGTFSCSESVAGCGRGNAAIYALESCFGGKDTFTVRDKMGYVMEKLDGKEDGIFKAVIRYRDIIDKTTGKPRESSRDMRLGDKLEPWEEIIGKFVLKVIGKETIVGHPHVDTKIQIFCVPWRTFTDEEYLRNAAGVLEQNEAINLMSSGYWGQDNKDDFNLGNRCNGNCGDGVVTSKSGEECDEGKNNGKPGSKCSLQCKSTEPIIVVAPDSPIPAYTATSIAVYNVPGNEILYGTDCGSDAKIDAQCIKFLNLADKDKKPDGIEVPEQYFLKPYSITKDERKQTVWMTRRNPYSPAQNEEVTYVLLGNDTKDPEHPLATTKVTFAAAEKPELSLPEIATNVIQYWKQKIVTLASLTIPHGLFAQPTLDTTKSITNTSGGFSNNVTVSLGNSPAQNSRFLLITPKDQSSSTPPAVVFINDNIVNNASFTTRITNTLSTSQTYNVTLDSQGDSASTPVATQDITMDGRDGECIALNAQSAVKRKAFRVLIIGSDADGLQESSIKELEHDLLRYVPFNELSASIDVRYYSKPVTVACIHAGDRENPSSRVQCAQEIHETFSDFCATHYDLIVVRGSIASWSWRGDSVPVLVVDSELTARKQSALIANAIGHRLGLGDEFEYDIDTARFEKVTPNCLVGGIDAVQQYWRDLLGTPVDKDHQIAFAKGCGDFPEVGLHAAEDTLMSKPLRRADDPNAFGTVNQAYIRKMLKVLE